MWKRRELLASELQTWCTVADFRSLPDSSEHKYYFNGTTKFELVKVMYASPFLRERMGVHC